MIGLHLCRQPRVRLDGRYFGGNGPITAGLGQETTDYCSGASSNSPILMLSIFGV